MEVNTNNLGYFSSSKQNEEDITLQEVNKPNIENLGYFSSPVIETQEENNEDLVDNSELLKELEKAYQRTNEAKADYLDAMTEEADELFWLGELNDEQIKGLDALILKYNELIAAEDAKVAAKSDDKASGKAKLKAGEALTDDEISALFEN